MMVALMSVMASTPAVAKISKKNVTEQVPTKEVFDPIAHENQDEKNIPFWAIGR